jgi:ABC-2 type transport system permease protein
MTATVTATHVPAGGASHELRATRAVWQREMIRFGRDQPRMVSSLVQPLLFMFVLGGGLGSLVSTGGTDIDFQTFLFPGVLATSVLFTAAFSGISMVWDRELGFLREMLVAPVSTASIVTGKCLGGASVATLQSLVILALAGLVGVPYHPVMLVELVLLSFLMAFLITAMALVLAARVKQIQAAMPMVQLIITPMMFMSGALFPLSGLPRWLDIATTINPMTYAVEPLRAVVFDHLEATAAARAKFDPGIMWGSWPVPLIVQVGVELAVSMAMLWLAIGRFSRTE